MVGEKPYKTEPRDNDERAIVAEMLRNPDSEYWNVCLGYVTKQVRRRAKGMHPSDQEEIVQETMEKALLKLSAFRFESALNSWLNVVIQRCIIDKYRKVAIQQRHLSSLPSLDDEEDEENLPIVSKSTEEVFEEREYLSAYVNALFEYAEKHQPTRDKLIIQLFIEDERNQAEIAEKLGCSAPTVKNVIDAAHRYAQEEVKKNAYEEEEESEGKSSHMIWTKQEITQLKQRLRNQTVQVLLELAAERMEEGVDFTELCERTKRTQREVMGDLAGFSQLLRRHFGRAGQEEWPIEVKWGTSPEEPTHYRMQPEIAQWWRESGEGSEGEWQWSVRCSFLEGVGVFHRS